MPTINKSGTARKSPKGLQYVPISKNILRHPLARHGRCKLEWIDNTKRKTRKCAVTPDVSLELPIGCGIKRHLNGFDMVALLTLVAMARRNDCKTKASNPQIIAAMGVPDTKFNQRRLRDALNLLSHVTIHYRSWYWPAGTRNTTAVLERASFKVMTVAGAGRNREFHMDPEWVDANRNYFFPLKPPLPTQSNALNLLMLLLPQGRKGPDEEGWYVRRFRSDRMLTRPMGMNHRDRSAGLASACAALTKWFRDHDCRLRWTEWKSGSEFRYKLPTTRPEEKRTSTSPEETIRACEPGSEVDSIKTAWRQLGYDNSKRPDVFEDEFADY